MKIWVIMCNLNSHYASILSLDHNLKIGDVRWYYLNVHMKRRKRERERRLSSHVFIFRVHIAISLNVKTKCIFEGKGNIGKCISLIETRLKKEKKEKFPEASINRLHFILWRNIFTCIPYIQMHVVTSFFFNSMKWGSKRGDCTLQWI